MLPLAMPGMLPALQAICILLQTSCAALWLRTTLLTGPIGPGQGELRMNSGPPRPSDLKEKTGAQQKEMAALNLGAWDGWKRVRCPDSQLVCNSCTSSGTQPNRCCRR